MNQLNQDVNKEYDKFSCSTFFLYADSTSVNKSQFPFSKGHRQGQKEKILSALIFSVRFDLNLQ